MLALTYTAHPHVDEEEDEDMCEYEYEYVEQEEGRSSWAHSCRVCWLSALDMQDTYKDRLHSLIRPDKNDIRISDYFLNDSIAEYSIATLRRFYETKENSDITVCAEDGSNPIKAHRDVLKIHSEYFRALCGEIWQQIPSNNVVCLDFPAHILELVMYYFYSGSTTGMFETGCLLPCLQLAHHLIMPALVLELSEGAGRCIDKENVSSLLSFSDALNLPFLKEKCVSFAVSNLTDIDHLEFYQELPCRVKVAIRGLQRSYLQCRSSYGNIFHSIRELIAMMGEAQEEEEEAYAKASQQLDEEMSNYETDVALSLVAVDSERMQRFQRVRSTLELQHQRLKERRKFYTQQKQALDILLKNY
mmetsp:Transcript_3760/g.5835  ORF Transcript_3760/g.5835 Transcript_3760/m.5835 type:complete len:360 (-) Transcript_3760:193-1272(-)